MKIFHLSIKATAGGKRTGAGRKTNEDKGLEKPLVTKCFRVDGNAFDGAQKLHGKLLNKKINDFIKRLAKAKV